MIRAAAPVFIVLTAAAALAATTPRTEPRASQWTTPAARLAALSQEPGSCLGPAPNPQQARSIAIGAAAFRAPLLLGGQAARSGLSCNACHRGGHDNPGFSYPGLSGAPGTADVTSSLFSSHRGDGQFNPRPIPNLSGDKALLKVDQSPASEALENFINGLIREEFDGPPAPPAVLTGLADYVRALSPGTCTAPRVIDLTGALAHVDAALDNAEWLARSGDGPAARLLVSAARSELGLIDERYHLPRLAKGASALQRASAALGVIERRMATNPTGVLPELRRWRAAAASWQRPLRAAEARSLYNPRVLMRWLAAGA